MVSDDGPGDEFSEALKEHESRAPAWAWERYETRCFKLARDVFNYLGETVEMDKPPEVYISEFHQGNGGGTLQTFKVRYKIRC